MYTVCSRNMCTTHCIPCTHCVLRKVYYLLGAGKAGEGPRDGRIRGVEERDEALTGPDPITTTSHSCATNVRALRSNSNPDGGGGGGKVGLGAGVTAGSAEAEQLRGLAW